MAQLRGDFRMQATWERHGNEFIKGTFWTWDKYKISKVTRPDEYKTTGYKLINTDHPKLIEIYDTLEIAKNAARIDKAMLDAKPMIAKPMIIQLAEMEGRNKNVYR
jgi:hypothetical protein